MIASRCKDCGHTLEASEREVGQSVSCPKCGRPVKVEDPSQSSTRSEGPDTNPTVGFKPDAPSSEYGFLSPPEGAGELGVLAHYRVLKLLGQGGMGMVFQALDIHLQRPVALKVIRPELSKDAEFRQRFLREARATAAVKSDHIVTIHQVGQDNDVPFLAMEFLEGKPLDAWLERAGPGRHRRGAPHRHRDRPRPGGRPSARPDPPRHQAGQHLDRSAGRAGCKILDFGLARRHPEQARLTQTGLIMGTPEYMAPEQAEGKTVDSRCDLFSLGCVLYELASGVQPFDGPSVMAILKAVALKEPEPLRNRFPNVPADFEELVSQLLAKNPADRPKSTREVADRLRQMAGVGTVSGRRYPGRSRMSGRRWLLVGLGLLFLVGGFATWQS